MKTMRVDAGSERTINSETESLNKTKANDAISRARLAKDDAAKIKYSKYQDKNLYETEVKNSRLQHLVNTMFTSEKEKYKVTVLPMSTPKRKIRLNLTELGYKSNRINSNIFSLTIGEITRKDLYKYQLRAEVYYLKKRVYAEYAKRISHSFKTQTINTSSVNSERNVPKRRSLCGRIYRKSNNRFAKHSKEQSNYYKWNPLLYDSECGLSNPSTLNKNVCLENRIEPALKIRPFSTYRNRKLELKSSTYNYYISCRVYCQTAQYFHQRRGYKVTPRSLDPSNKELEFYSIDEIQISVYGQSEYSKMESILKKFTSSFRKSITDKLGIPKYFPLSGPSPFNSQYENMKVVRGMYELLRIDVYSKESESKNEIILRKYQNCLYSYLGKDCCLMWNYDGAVYIGGWNADIGNSGVKQGYGLEYVPGKYVYCGEFAKGQRHGNGILQMASTKLKKITEESCVMHEGGWFNNYRHGFGRQIDEANNEYIGNWQYGEQTGYGCLKTAEGSLYAGYLLNRVKHGKGYEYLSNGDQYEGDFYRGVFHGYGCYTWKNGNCYIGGFERGKRKGQGVWQARNGAHYEGSYDNDLKHGYGTYTWSNGEVYAGNFSKDLRDGYGYYRYPNGKVAKFLWKYGNIVKKLYSQYEEVYRCRNRTAEVSI